MNQINRRIRIIFEKEKKSKTDIARLLNVTPAYISKLTTNENAVPSDRLINDICSAFQVNKNWLLSGDGDQYIELNRDQEISEFIGKVMHEEDDSFKKRFIAALSGLTSEDWKALERIADEIEKRKAGQ